MARLSSTGDIAGSAYPPIAPTVRLDASTPFPAHGDAAISGSRQTPESSRSAALSAPATAVAEHRRETDAAGRAQIHTAPDTRRG